MNPFRISPAPTRRMLILGAILAIAIGVVLGLIGGGGSMLTLPLLVYLLSVDPRSAVATSLIVVGATSVVALVSHVREVRWSTGLVVGAFGMVGATLGARLAAYVPPALLLGGFAVLMIGTAARMLNGSSSSTRGHAGLPTRALIGTGIGLASGLFGAGGGFLIVPALVTFGGLAMRQAIATSLLVIAMQALGGTLMHASHVALDPVLIGTITAATSLGALVGARLSSRVDAASLRRGFGVLVLVTGGGMLLRELPRTVLRRPETPLVLLALAAVAIALLVSAAESRRRSRPRSSLRS